jgi:zinc protease
LKAKEIKEIYLNNGLKVILIEDHKWPIATFQIYYKVGSRNENIGKTGLSHLTEHLMFKGTKKYKDGDFSAIIAKNGGNDNAFTNKDVTGYYEILSSDRIYIPVELEADRMKNLSIDKKEFELEKSVVKEERRLRYEDDPTSLLVEDVYATAFKIHPYHWPVIGWMQDLTSLTIKDFYEYYRRYYVPNNAIIVIGGDFDSNLIISKIKEYFSNIPKGNDIPKIRIKEPEQKGERRIILRNKEAELPFVFITYHLPNIGDKDEYPLDILFNILTSGKSSRLYRKLVYEKGIALYAGGYYSKMSADPDLGYFYGSIRPGKDYRDFEKVVYEEIKNIGRGKVSERELEKAKNKIEAAFILNQDSILYYSMNVGILETLGIGYKYMDKYIQNIRNVKKDDIIRVANKYFSSDNRTVGVLIPKKEK